VGEVLLSVLVITNSIVPFSCFIPTQPRRGTEVMLLLMRYSRQEIVEKYYDK